MRRALLLAVLLAAGATLAAAEQPSADEQAAMKRAFEAHRRGDYLIAPEVLRPLALTPDGAIRDDDAWQRWAEAEALLTGEPPQRPPSEPPTPPSDADRAMIARIGRADARDAIAEIVDRAKRTRIVIVNEYHLVPRSRAFALAVARALRPLGYDVLAAETFSNSADPARYASDMARLTKEGYARRLTGYYSQDPVYASFLREALALGYRPVAYEMTNYDLPADLTPAARIRIREQDQTDYLMVRAVGGYPHSKILIFVGHGHVREAAAENGELWMAARLKQASGIDPLTIDQTKFLSPAIDPTGVTAAAIARAKRRSVVLSDRAGPVIAGRWAGGVDLQVIHPRLAPVAGRPGWLAALGRRPVPIPAALYPTGGRRLIQAFPAGSAKDAVPIDQVLAQPGIKPPPLMLDRRPYELRFQDIAAGPAPPPSPPSLTRH